MVPSSQHLIENALDKFCSEHPVIPLCMDGAKTYVHLVIRHFSAFAVSASQFNITDFSLTVG